VFCRSFLLCKELAVDAVGIFVDFTRSLTPIFWECRRSFEDLSFVGGNRGMNLREDFELLESLFVELDPLADGFVGILVEVQRQGDRYVLLETAPATGNRLLAFSSKHKELVYDTLNRELCRLRR
jgi:hypothetical protein